MGVLDNLKHAWDVFRNRSPTYVDLGYGSSYRPDWHGFTRGVERSIVTSINNRIAMDVAAISIQHVKVDSNGRFLDTVKSGLNQCLTQSANIDQTGFSFRLDIAASMLDEGCIAIVPTEVNERLDAEHVSTYSINSVRVGKIVEWYPKHVRVKLYNEETGQQEEIVLPKSYVAVVENPFYAVMNEPNAIAQRLIRKLNMLDAIDEQTSSGKLDMIIHLPYSTRDTIRREQAEKRKADLEAQLCNSKYGVAWLDQTEKITQLNRPIENNMLEQIDYLTNMLYSQLNMTQSIMDGTADEKVMLNYYNRTVEPILTAIVEAMQRTFLTKTAISQGQRLMYFRNTFKLTPVTQIAEISDKLTRNEIATANEIRQIIGWKPADDPNADKLKNSNIKGSNEEQDTVPAFQPTEGENQNGYE